MENEQLQYRLKNIAILGTNCNGSTNGDCNGNANSLKRQWSDDLIDDKSPLNSPSLIQIYMENNNCSLKQNTKDVPVTVYSNDGVHKVFVFDKIESE